ncbi:MAG: glycosyltransferase [Solirubrobacterales bacterium]
MEAGIPIAEPGARESVAVLVPFRGDREQARRALDSLVGLELGPRDELIVADNSDDGLFADAADDEQVRVVPAPGERSSYHARNVAAEAAPAQWLLFIDADCRPPHDLIERYFDREIPVQCGLVAGGVEGVPGQDSLVARWSRSRGILDPVRLSELNPRTFGATANLLVRRAAWEGVGGFQEGIRSGGDAEFCWRVQDAGWSLIHAPDAAVAHQHRERVRALARVSARYGAGRAWLNRHRPGSTPRPRVVRGLLRCAAAAPALTLLGRFERARFKLVDAVDIAATALGYHLFSNRPPATDPIPGEETDFPPTAILCDSFPVLSETFVAAEAHELQAPSVSVRVEALHRPERPSWEAARGLRVGYVEDEPPVGRIAALIALCARHPLRSLRDLLGRLRWPAENRVPLASLAPMALRLRAWGARHLHAHFAAASAVTAARLGRLLGISHSVTAHAHEIFRRPEGLIARLDGAAFVTSGCEYNVEHLRGLLEGSIPLHEIVMGVDPNRFSRRRPYPGGRRVVGIGRLVEKKGFDHLIEAAAILERDRPLDRVVIVGDGPRRGELERRIELAGLSHRVSLPGALDPGTVRDELECADLLSMPCVIAADGDRDSMPVVVKEALAMEIPVVASDEVGLPELVRPEFGRLVPPGDPEALAEAIAEVLALDPGERTAMGARGRVWVSEHANVGTETAKLAALIERAAGARG